MKKKNKDKVSKELKKLLDLIQKDNISILDCEGIEYDYQKKSQNIMGAKVTSLTGVINIRMNLSLYKELLEEKKKKKKEKIIYTKEKRKSRQV